LNQEEKSMTRITGPIGAVNPHQLVPPEIQLANRMNEILDQSPLTPKQLASIKKEFECLSPGVRDFMYKQLNSEGLMPFGGLNPIGGELRQKFLTLDLSQQNALLKILNPKHKPMPGSSAPAETKGHRSEQSTMEILDRDVKWQIEQAKLAEAEQRRRIEMALKNSAANGTKVEDPKPQNPNSLNISDPVPLTVQKDGKKVP
jgi:hypothetical protein